MAGPFDDTLGAGFPAQQDQAGGILRILSAQKPSDPAAINPATTAAMAQSRDAVTKMLQRQLQQMDSPFAGLSDVATAAQTALATRGRTPVGATLESLDQNRIGKATQIANTLSQVANREAGVGSRSSMTPYQQAQVLLRGMDHAAKQGNRDAILAKESYARLTKNLDPESAQAFMLDWHNTSDEIEKRTGKRMNADEINDLGMQILQSGGSRYKTKTPNLQLSVNPLDGSKELFNPKTGATGQAALSDRGSRPGYDNNVGNMRPGPAWQGSTGAVTTGSGKFDTFDSPQSGVRANVLNVMTQMRRLGPERATLDYLATIWAPSGDGNDPRAWASSVGKMAGLAPGMPVDSNDPVVMARLIKAINIHEKGRQTVSDEDITRGVTAAYANNVQSSALPAQGTAQQEPGRVPLPPMAQGIPPIVGQQAIKSIPETGSRIDSIIRARDAARDVPNALGMQGALIDGIGGILQQVERAIGAPGALGTEKMKVNEISQARDTFNLLFSKLLPTLTGDSGRYSNFDVQLAGKMARFRSSLSSVEQATGFLTLVRDMEVRALRRQLSLAGPGGRAIYETFSPEIKQAMESPDVVDPRDGEAPYDDIKVEGMKAYVKKKGTNQWFEVQR